MLSPLSTILAPPILLHPNNRLRLCLHFMDSNFPLLWMAYTQSTLWMQCLFTLFVNRLIHNLPLRFHFRSQHTPTFLMPHLLLNTNSSLFYVLLVFCAFFFFKSVHLSGQNVFVQFISFFQLDYKCFEDKDSDLYLYPHPIHTATSIMNGLFLCFVSCLHLIQAGPSSLFHNYMFIYCIFNVSMSLLILYISILDLLLEFNRLWFMDLVAM